MVLEINEKKSDASYKVLAIVQARMGSKRLPNKMLLASMDTQ